MTNAELRRLAEAATQGEWSYGDWSGQCHLKHYHGNGNCKYEYTLHVGRGTNLVLKNEPITLVTSTDEYCALSKENAAYIAAFNPAQVIALLDRIKELETGRSVQWPTSQQAADASVEWFNAAYQSADITLSRFYRFGFMACYNYIKERVMMGG